MVQAVPRLSGFSQRVDASFTRHEPGRRRSKGVIAMAERRQDDERYGRGDESRQGGNADRHEDDRESGRSRRGFAAMDPEQQREIARMGGRASHEHGRGHEFTPEEAREAGRKGGQARWR
jgi:general stress protein YciG